MFYSQMRQRLRNVATMTKGVFGGVKVSLLNLRVVYQSSLVMVASWLGLHLKSTGRRLKLGHRFSNRRMIPNCFLKWILWANITLLKWPSEVYTYKPSLCQEITKFTQEWSNIWLELCQKLINCCQKHLAKVQVAKGHLSTN